MVAHKGALASAAGRSEAAAAASMCGDAPGFRHFLGTPRFAQRYKAYGIDPLSAPGHVAAVRALMNRLSRRMDAEIHWP